MNEQFYMVKQFHEKFKTPFKDKPEVMLVERAKKRYSWMLEEIDEFMQASQKQDIYQQADAMIDLIYFALGTLVEMGIEPKQLFDAVHDANMRKLVDDKPLVRSSDGKIVKPDGWVGPEKQIKEIIDKMNG